MHVQEFGVDHRNPKYLQKLKVVLEYFLETVGSGLKFCRFVITLQNIKGALLGDRGGQDTQNLFSGSSS